jgi:hypothetical protein
VQSVKEQKAKKKPSAITGENKDSYTPKVINLLSTFQSFENVYNHHRYERKKITRLKEVKEMGIHGGNGGGKKLNELCFFVQ